MADPREHDPSHPSEWELLARHLAGEGDPAERARVERLLAERPDHAALLEALDVAVRPPEPLPLSAGEVDAAFASVMARRGATVTPLHAGPRRSRIPMRIAASLLVIAGGALLWRAMTPTSAPEHELERPVFASAIGALDSLHLSDGTRVVLGPASTLEVQLGAGAGKSARTVSLRGQAKFDVAHDPAHPFMVKAGRVLLRDIGTSFAVESDASGEVRVAVSEGVVALALDGARAGSEDTLRAGDRAVVSPSGTMGVARGAVTADDLAWLERRLVLRDAPLTRVAADLRRWYGLELRVADSTLGSRHLTATFDRGTRADVGRLLGAALGAAVIQSGDTIWLRPTAEAVRP